MATTTSDTTGAERYSPGDVLKRVQRDVERSLLRVRNGLKYAAGVDQPGVGLTPKDTVWTYEKLQLWRYRSDRRRLSPPVLLVMSLVSRSYIFDLRPGNSMVEHLLGRGFDVYVLDWGVPDHLEADNTLSTYLDEYLPAAVDAVCRTSGSDAITMVAYCFGGVLGLLYAAGHPGRHLRNLVTMATPIDSAGSLNSVLAEGRLEPEDLFGDDGNVPAEVIENMFRMLKPTQEAEGYVNLWENLWNDQFVEAYQAMNGWGRDQIPFPGAAFAEMVRTLNRSNQLPSGTVRIGGRDLRLADITCPLLAVLGEKDHIVPLESARGLPALVGSKDTDELVVRSGHVGLFVGKTAHKNTLPPLCDWIEARSDEGRS